MKALLDDGNSVVLIPGGIREIQKMRPDVEVAFLKNRYGFVKLAIQTGTPIVPAFVFGQSDTYKQMKYRPKPFQKDWILGGCRMGSPMPLDGRSAFNRFMYLDDGKRLFRIDPRCFW